MFIVLILLNAVEFVVMYCSPGLEYPIVSPKYVHLAEFEPSLPFILLSMAICKLFSTIFISFCRLYSDDVKPVICLISAMNWYNLFFLTYKKFIVYIK